MKKFPDFPQGDSGKMPQTGKKGRYRPSKEPFPQSKAKAHRQIVTQLQISPAQAEGGKKPRSQQKAAEQQLRQPGEPPMDGAQQIHPRSKQRACQKAPQQPGQEHRRGHDRHLPLRRGCP